MDPTLATTWPSFTIWVEIRDLMHMTSDLLTINRSLHDKVISRPCIAERKT